MNSNEVFKHKNIAILGSTGSIGRQTLDIIAEYSDRFCATVLVAGSKVEHLIEQAIKFRPQYVLIADESKYAQLNDALAPLGIHTAAGAQAIADAMTLDCIDTVVTATVGYSGLAPTISAIKANKDIALANKETLVVAGELVTELLKKSTSKVVPVDSEHSAIYQCLVGEEPQSIKKLIITASGGPFRTFEAERLKTVTVNDALRHPNWDMGAKITIDSATMLNKAFEIIEAHWLFGVDANRIEAVVHPQSIIHSMVEYIDNSVIAQMGTPDMRTCIQYAITYPQRQEPLASSLDFAKLATLTFEEPDFDTFSLLSLAYYAVNEDGVIPAVLNASDEIAVDAFLKGKIKFTDIFDTVSHMVRNFNNIKDPTLDDIKNADREARIKTKEYISASYKY